MKATNGEPIDTVRAIQALLFIAGGWCAGRAGTPGTLAIVGTWMILTSLGWFR